LAAALAAGQWLPSLEASRRSARATLTEAARGHWSLTPALLGQALVPAPLSILPLRQDARQRLFGGRDAFLASIYLGLPALALVAGPLPRRRRRVRHALLATAAVALGLSLGLHTPLYSWASAVPGLSALRYPAKGMVLAGLCWALLAGLGFDGWLRARPSARRAIVLVTLLLGAGIFAALSAASAWRARPEVWTSLVSVGSGLSLRSALLPLTHALAILAAACLGMAFALWMRRRAWGPPALALVAVADLFAAHHALNPTAPVALFTHRPPLLDALRGTGEGEWHDRRVWAYDYFQPGASETHLGRSVPYLPVRGPAGWSVPAVQALGLRQYLFPPVGGAWKVAGSFDRDVSGFGSAEVARLSALLHEAEASPELHLRFLRLGGVTHVVALHAEGWPHLVPLATVEGLFPEPLRLFQVPDTLPRAYLAHGRVLTGTPPAPHHSAVDTTATADASAGTARILEISADAMEIEVEATRPAELIVLDAFDPHWVATVDGVSVPVHRANTAFRAVQVDAGRHRVQMRYRPWPVFAGLAVTLCALGAMAWLLATRRGPAPA
jgi:hypothetical protein